MGNECIGFIGISLYSKDSSVVVAYAVNSVVSRLPEGFILGIYIDGPISDCLHKFVDELASSKQQFKVIVVKSYVNKGLPLGLNTLVRLGRELGAKYYFRMDADDVALPGRFEKQIAFMESNPDVDICGSSIVEFVGENDYEPNLGVSKRTVPLSHPGIYSGLARTATFNHPTVCFRYASLIKWNPSLDVYDESAGLAEDYKLWVDLAEAGFKFANIAEPLLAFRITEDFYRRRSKARAIAEHKVRMDAMRRLNLFSLKNLLYAYVVLFLRFMPPKILKLAYRFKRKSSAIT